MPSTLPSTVKGVPLENTILDGHGSHITFQFVDYCERNDIILYCLPPHSTHLLQPLDVGLFSPLQHHYAKAVEDYFLTTSVSINRDTFFPIFKQARRLTYVSESIQGVFRSCGIVPLQSHVVLEKLQAPKPELTKAITLESTPYTQCELC